MPAAAAAPSSHHAAGTLLQSRTTSIWNARAVRSEAASAVGWPWVMAYSGIIVAVSEGISRGSKLIDEAAPIKVEVLILAFILGCMLARSPNRGGRADDEGADHAAAFTSAQIRSSRRAMVNKVPAVNKASATSSDQPLCRG